MNHIEQQNHNRSIRHIVWNLVREQGMSHAQATLRAPAIHHYEVIHSLEHCYGSPLEEQPRTTSRRRQATHETYDDTDKASPSLSDRIASVHSFWIRIQSQVSEVDAATLVSYSALVGAAPTVVKVLEYIDSRGLLNVLANPFEAPLSIGNLYGIGCWVVGLLLSVSGPVVYWKVTFFRLYLWKVVSALVMISALIADPLETAFFVAGCWAVTVFARAPALRVVLTTVAAVAYGLWKNGNVKLSLMTLQG